MSLLDNPQPAPDIAFLRNTGIALLTLALVAGSISLTGSLKAVELPVQINPVGDLAQSTDQAGYINPTEEMQ
jgi:hypothetical protein